MPTSDFWVQFWPQFWGGVAATLFVALITFVFTYIARIRIAKFMKRVIESVKNGVVNEEEKLKEELFEK